MKIKKQKDGNYYEKIVTWTGEGDYKNAYIVLFSTLLALNLILTMCYFGNCLGSNSNLMALFNLIIIILSPLLILFGKYRKITFRRITN